MNSTAMKPKSEPTSFAESTLPTGSPPVLAFLLALLGIAVFTPILYSAYALADNFLMLTSVSRAATPWIFFVADWGVGGNFYRPLLSLSFWVIYYLFGIWTLPNQLLSLACHFAVVFLTLRIVLSLKVDGATAFLFTALVLVSM